MPIPTQKTSTHGRAEVGLVRLTVRRAIVIAVLLGMLIPALATTLTLARFYYGKKLDAEISHSLERNTALVALGVRESLWALDKESANALLEAMLQDPALVSVEVLDPHLGRFVFREAPPRRQGNLHRLERPVMHREELIGRVRLELTETPLLETLHTQLLTSAGVLGLQLLVSLVLILAVLERRVGQPLLRLGDEAEALARGDLDKPIVSVRNDEIGQVEARLEITRQALQELFRTLEQKNTALEVDLRERMRVEASLRDREQRLRTLVEQSPLAVIEFDLGWHVLDWNDAAVRIFGWRREEILGRHVFMLLAQHPSTSDDNLHRLLDHSLSESQAKLNCIRSDQSEIICQWYNNVIRDASGVRQRIVVMIEDITERQRADDEVRRLATALRLTSSLVLLTGPDGQVEWFNQAFSERYPRSSGILGSALAGVLEFFTPADAPASPLAEIDAVFATGQKLTGLEFPLHHTQGGDFWVSLELQPILDETGQILQWVALLTDITERRAMADTLGTLARLGADLAPKAFFEHLLRSLAHGTGAQAACLITRADASFDISAAIASQEWPLAPGPHKLQGSLCERLLTVEGTLLIKRDAFEAICHDPALGGCTHTEALAIAPIIDGLQRPLGHLILLFDAPLSQTADLQSLLELGAARAATESLRQQALQALRHSEQKFFSIFQYSPIPIALLRSSDSICLDINPSFLDSFGYQREDLVGHTVADTPIYVDLSERRWILDLLDHAGEVSGADMRLRTHDGDIRDCQLYIRPVTMGEDACLLVAAVDVTQLLEAQRQVEELNQSLERRVVERTQALASTNSELEKALDHLHRTLDELVRSEKLAALGSLVAGIAHELNTPIGNSLMVASTLHDANTVFRTRLEEGLRRSTLDEHIAETETATDILLRNLGRAAELISSFKQVAVDQTSSQRRRFDLSEVVGEIIVTMHPVFRKTPFSVENTIPPGIRLDSYPGPFGQVIANLLNNAILHAFDGRKKGRIILSAEMQDDAHVTLDCTDDGIGIPPENLRRIFDPFFTTRLGREGTGLGLNIVHNIVTGILGGEVRVRSEPGAGASFSLRLPLKAPESRAELPGSIIGT